MGAGWSEVGVEGVPLELVYRVLGHVSLRDLTTLLATSSFLRNLIEESPLLWSHVHTKELWPNENTWPWFERAARCGNVEASIKLAVALLYNEGVSIGKSVRNRELAYTLFESLETGGHLGLRSQLWLLYRPPWGAQPLCSKRYVFTRVSHVAQLKGASWAIRVLSRMSEVLVDGLSHSDTFQVNWVKLAVEDGDLHARLLQWRSRYEKRHAEGALDPGTELQAIRDVRELCLTGYYPANLALSRFLATSRYPRVQCLPEIREFLQSSPPSRTWYALNYQQHVTPHMYYVLVDWLCEVANMKFHTSSVLHAATQIVEAYLSMEQVKCNQLQLIGITALLLATRFKASACILTVTEASWVTADTYSYSHVVRTIGHIMAALKANLALPTILDYATVLLESVKAPVLVQEWTRFVCDLAITCSFPPRTSLAQIATSCVLLGYILSRLPWPNLPAISGFCHSRLVQPLAIIYSKNFNNEGSKCQRSGIFDRHSLAAFCVEQVGLQPVPSLGEILEVLSLSEAEYRKMVTEDPILRDDSSMETDAAKSGRRSYAAEKADRSLLQHLQHQESHHSPLMPVVGGKFKHDSGLPVITESSVGISGQWRAGERALGGHSSRTGSNRMECSDSESSQESVSAAVSPIREQLRLRTDNTAYSGACLLPSRPHSLVQSSLEDDLDQSQRKQADSAMSPSQHRHFELPEENVIQREAVVENPSETTDSEESEGPGTKSARVNLKRKLEHASESERSEKCLILDVGNLQLG